MSRAATRLMSINLDELHHKQYGICQNYQDRDMEVYNFGPE